MKKRFKLILIFSVLFSIMFKMSPVNVNATPVYEPPYAKWGKIAVEKTKEQYPQADIIDYLHIGREWKSTNVAVEKFKLWLRVKSGNREFGVFVNVEFEPSTDRYLGISYRETDR
ncbi:hypothetical protein ABID96_002259 [Bacillus sp. OAE603]